MSRRLATVEHDHHTALLEVEKLRDLEALRKEFDLQRRQLRQEHDREINEFKHWRKYMMIER